MPAPSLPLCGTCRQPITAGAGPPAGSPLGAASPISGLGGELLGSVCGAGPGIRQVAIGSFIGVNLDRQFPEATGGCTVQLGAADTRTLYRVASGVRPLPPDSVCCTSCRDGLVLLLQAEQKRSKGEYTVMADAVQRLKQSANTAPAVESTAAADEAEMQRLLRQCERLEEQCAEEERRGAELESRRAQLAGAVACIEARRARRDVVQSWREEDYAALVAKHAALAEERDRLRAMPAGLLGLCPILVWKLDHPHRRACSARGHRIGMPDSFSTPAAQRCGLRVGWDEINAALGALALLTHEIQLRVGLIEQDVMPSKATLLKRRCRCGTPDCSVACAVVPMQSSSHLLRLAAPDAAAEVLPLYGSAGASTTAMDEACKLLGHLTEELGAVLGVRLRALQQQSAAIVDGHNDGWVYAMADLADGLGRIAKHCDKHGPGRLQRQQQSRQHQARPAACE
eukprot:TRINITY_DN8933_c0_g1_i1.p1 TRINITY_DN8933_c0_g1~~TRINITY_DN8933_c0_g1_i1.p1  ORF type:complete len:481 (+),score=150.02 TRINITY_DN8933_c0_g1_i1:77-1444(+)